MTIKKNRAKAWNPHTVLPVYCADELKHRSSYITQLLKEEKFVMNHYLGSWDSYSRPNDSRMGGLRTYDAWLERSNFTRGEFSIVSRPWLKGFVQLVGGPKIAAYLLQDAGKISRANNNNDISGNDDNSNNNNNIDKWKWKYKLNARPGKTKERPITRGLPGHKSREKRINNKRSTR
mmetsp:Transcript_51239/g.57262  ORF Transcript_51239/g.57262 Transcript_51239/m.57262 type:complete len:177 (+) Transcript_51239:64-594(+)